MGSPDRYVAPPKFPPANPMDGGIGNAKRSRHSVEVTRRRKEISLKSAVDSYGPNAHPDSEMIVDRARKFESYLAEGDDDR